MSLCATLIVLTAESMHLFLSDARTYSCQPRQKALDYVVASITGTQGGGCV